MGIKSIMGAKRIILLASGPEKAEAVAAAVSGPVIPGVPASILQLHPDVTFVVDGAAAAKL
ncbi:MAG: Glucosamine-6-phosphate deaminase [Synergistetes bacterium ADurb.Bin520]|nr:MAG: Glucosamine-6-phosphate deaminase [Synergistetes bacterium ADurb.Bin520]